MRILIPVLSVIFSIIQGIAARPSRLQGQPVCGQAELPSIGAGKQLAPFLLPWVVSVEGSEEQTTRSCAGAVIHSRFILTSLTCYEEQLHDNQYNVYCDNLDCHEATELKVKETYKVNDRFLLLEVRTPLTPDHIICLRSLPVDELVHGEVYAASWAFNGDGSNLTEDKLYYEKWTLPDAPGTCDGKPSQSDPDTVCALSGSAVKYACKGDVGSPIMLRKAGTWNLIGMVTHLSIEQKQCVITEDRTRLFHRLTSADLESIQGVIKTKERRARNRSYRGRISRMRKASWGSGNSGSRCL